MGDVEEILQKLKSQKGVIGIVIATAEGVPIKTTLDNATTAQYAGLITHLVDKTRSTVRDLDPNNDVTFLRIRTKKHEIMVSSDKGYFLMVLQNPPE